MRATVTALLVLIAFNPAFASENRIQQPQSITVQFSPDQRVVFEVASEKVTSITIHLGESAFRVPETVCAKISHVQFDTVRLLWDGRFETAPKADFFFLRFSAGAESTRAFGELPEINLFFSNQQFDRTRVTKKINDSTWGTFAL